MRQLKRRISVLVGVTAVVAFAATPAGIAGAKITPASCTNGGGNQPSGQQPTCTGSGLTQEPATNPTGHAPPGQQ
jgi:hypothetical protein